MPPSLPEVWLRGPIAGFPPELMPVAHSLLQVLEEVDAVIRPLSFDELWTRPGDAASIGFHLKHLAGSLDRLLTYARGESLTVVQRSALDGEERAGLANDQPAMLLRAARDAIERALEQNPRDTRGDAGRAAPRRAGGFAVDGPRTVVSCRRARPAPLGADRDHRENRWRAPRPALAEQFPWYVASAFSVFYQADQSPSG